MNRKQLIASAAAAVVFSAASTFAASVANVSVLVSTDGSTYSSSLSGLTANSTVFYEVVGNLLPGASNGAKNLNAVQTAHPDANTANYDGLNNLEFNLAASGGTFASGNIFSDSGSNGADFTKITGSGIGSSTATSYTDVKTGLAPGFYSGADANHLAVIFTGAFNYTGGTQTIAASYDGQAGFEFNSNPSTGTTSLANKVNVSGADVNGYLSFSSATLSDSSPVPAPALIPGLLAGMFGLGGMNLLRRRGARLA